MFKLACRTDNAAFEPRAAEELCIILDRVKSELMRGYQEGAIRDTNGNVVGSWQHAENQSDT